MLKIEFLNKKKKKKCSIQNIVLKNISFYLNYICQKQPKVQHSIVKINNEKIISFTKKNKKLGGISLR